MNTFGDRKQDEHGSLSAEVSSVSEPVLDGEETSPSGPSQGTSYTSSASLLDLRGTPCPINFVRTKLKLEQMEAGSLLEVWLDPGEPIEQVPNSLVMSGYELEAIEERTEYFVLQVRRPVAS
jgi:TusA-related sulfurtransferase